MKSGLDRQLSLASLAHPADSFLALGSSDPG